MQLSENARLIVTTGGTGIAPRDVTPEATRAVCERLLEGVAERMRFEGGKKTPLAALSRATCGARGKVVILNLPGSPIGAIESLEAVIDLLPHALELLSGNTKHPWPHRSQWHLRETGAPSAVHGQAINKSNLGADGWAAAPRASAV